MYEAIFLFAVAVAAHVVVVVAPTVVVAPPVVAAVVVTIVVVAATHLHSCRVVQKLLPWLPAAVHIRFQLASNWLLELVS